MRISQNYKSRISVLSELRPAVYPARNFPAQKLILCPASHSFGIAACYLFYIVGRPCQLIQKTHEFSHGLFLRIYSSIFSGFNLFFMVWLAINMTSVKRANVYGIRRISKRNGADIVKEFAFTYLRD